MDADTNVVNILRICQITIPYFTSELIPRDCKAIQDQDRGCDGVYEIYPYAPRNTTAIEVYCDMSTDNGGWTVG